MYAAEAAMNTDRIQAQATHSNDDTDARDTLREARELRHDIRNQLNA